MAYRALYYPPCNCADHQQLYPSLVKWPVPIPIASIQGSLLAERMLCERFYRSQAPKAKIFALGEVSVSAHTSCSLQRSFLSNATPDGVGNCGQQEWEGNPLHRGQRTFVSLNYLYKKIRLPQSRGSY